MKTTGGEKHTLKSKKKGEYKLCREGSRVDWNRERPTKEESRGNRGE